MTATVLPAKPSPTVWHGDCRQIIKQFLPSDSISAIVTDPPYGLEFMGQEWDRYTLAEYQAWCQQWATECFRVLKPGGYLLAFGSTRTSHRLACGVEDAGFGMRDTITWVYSQGFPKSQNISKDIDKIAGVEREVIGSKSAGQSSPHRVNRVEQGYRPNLTACTPESIDITTPATEAAKQWNGWGTALKPSSEPVIVARKPFKGTVAQNVLTHGTGGINIDACRVPGKPWTFVHSEKTSRSSGIMGRVSSTRSGLAESHDAGRWPSNLVLSHASTVDGEDACADGCVPGCPVAELDAQSGITYSTDRARLNTAAAHNRTASMGQSSANWTTTGYSDSGGASRFYPVFRYQAKAPTSQRPKINGLAHPTVKPLALIEWLVQLVTPAGGLLLDPFAGTGTTGIAAMRLGVVSILIENDPRYWPHITAKIEQEMALR